MDDFLPVIECFVYYDGPIFFLTRRQSTQSIAMLINNVTVMVGSHCVEADFTYLVTPITNKNLSDMKKNKISLYDVTKAAHTSYVVTWDRHNGWSDHSFILGKDIPDEWLATKGVMLDYEHAD